MTRVSGWDVAAVVAVLIGIVFLASVNTTFAARVAGDARRLGCDVVDAATSVLPVEGGCSRGER